MESFEAYPVPVVARRSLGLMTEPTAGDTDIEARLDELQRASQARRAELLAIAAQLPEATSRRVLVTAMFRSVVDAPNKPTVAKRVLLKGLRAPVDLVRRRRV